MNSSNAFPLLCTYLCRLILLVLRNDDLGTTGELIRVLNLHFNLVCLLLSCRVNLTDQIPKLPSIIFAHLGRHQLIVEYFVYFVVDRVV